MKQAPSSHVYRDELTGSAGGGHINSPSWVTKAPRTASSLWSTCAFVSTIAAYVDPASRPDVVPYAMAGRNGKSLLAEVRQGLPVDSHRSGRVSLW